MKNGFPEFGPPSGKHLCLTIWYYDEDDCFIWEAHSQAITYWYVVTYAVCTWVLIMQLCNMFYLRDAVCNKCFEWDAQTRQ